MDSTHSSRGWCGLEEPICRFLEFKEMCPARCFESWPVSQGDMHAAIACFCLTLSCHALQAQRLHDMSPAALGGASSCWPVQCCRWEDNQRARRACTRCIRGMVALVFLRSCFHAGALCAGIAHYAGTAKGLREEGIDPAARLRALPIAVRSSEPYHGTHVPLTSASAKPTAGLHGQGAGEAND